MNSVNVAEPLASLG